MSEHKLPALQFYPGDWRKDPGVQSLNYHDRGIWFEILLLMHESEQRGKLLLNGKPMPEEALARLLGVDKQILTTTLSTLLTYGVASLDDETGAFMSRRMVRDESVRQIKIKAGKLGGNPVLLKQTAKQNSTTGVKQKGGSSSSSSVSISYENLPPPSDGSDKAERSYVSDATVDLSAFNGEEPLDFYQRMFVGEWHSDTWRVFGMQVNTPDKLAAFAENLPLWMKTRKYLDGFGMNSIKFLVSGIWQRAPAQALMGGPQIVQQHKSAKELAWERA